MHRRGSTRAPLSIILAVVLAAGLTACGGDAPSAGSPSTTPDGESLAMTVTRKDDTFTPNAERVDLGINQKLVLTITSDTAGQLHIHSTPEQTIDYAAGTTEDEIVINRPGVVEVESHEPDQIVLQLEVR